MHTHYWCTGRKKRHPVVLQTFTVSKFCETLGEKDLFPKRFGVEPEVIYWIIQSCFVWGFFFIFFCIGIFSFLIIFGGIAGMIGNSVLTSLIFSTHLRPRLNMYVHFCKKKMLQGNKKKKMCLGMEPWGSQRLLEYIFEWAYHVNCSPVLTGVLVSSMCNAEEEYRQTWKWNAHSSGSVCSIFYSPDITIPEINSDIKIKEIHGFLCEKQQSNGSTPLMEIGFWLVFQYRIHAHSACRWGRS